MHLTVQGIQSIGAQATAKHSVGNLQEIHRSLVFLSNGTIVDAVTSNIDDRTLHELYVSPFANAVKAGVASVMCS
ncbi:glycoside hydrolase [Lipomyces starkeyi]